jgi:mRNA interferase MazF
MNNNDFPKRGEIWLTCFDPSVVTEIRKTRPALVISNDIANKKTTKVCVLPLTSNVKNIGRVVIVEPDSQNNLKVPSLIRVPEIMSFDKSRIKTKMGVLSEEKLKEVEEKLKLHLGL